LYLTAESRRQYKVHRSLAAAAGELDRSMAKKRLAGEISRDAWPREAEYL
jgi:hypothetical protein